MIASTWNRGNGQPDHRRVDQAPDRMLEHLPSGRGHHCSFGSAAQGELYETSDIDLLVVLADGDPADPLRTSFDICEAIGEFTVRDVELDHRYFLPLACQHSPHSGRSQPPL